MSKLGVLDLTQHWTDCNSSGAAHITSDNVDTHLGDNFDAPVGFTSGVVSAVFLFGFTSFRCLSYQIIQPNIYHVKGYHGLRKHLFQGAFNNYASINANWKDTTDMDNFRADGSGGLEVDSAAGTGYGNTVHTSSTNDTTY